MIEIKINTDIIKLDQFLKWCGAAESGAHAKIMIQEGSVKVNGQIELQRGKKLHKGDKVLLDGKEYIIV